MDQELTGKAFKRFMRRRGLSRDESYEQRHFGSEYVDEHLPPPPPLPPRNQPLPHRTTMLHGSGPGSRSTAGSSAETGSIRRTQSTFETGQGQTPRRRRRDDAEEPTKKQYRCEYCNLTFGRKHHKERHVANIHRQEKPYVCNLCGHPFHQKPNLDRHRATVHSEISPFRCDDCGLTFSRRSALRAHTQAVHDRNKRYECSLCRQEFSVGRDLTAHMRSEHPAHASSRTGGSSRGRGH